LRFIFEPVPRTGVMAGSYHNPARRLSSWDSETYHRRRGRFETEMNSDIVAGYHLGCCSGKILRGETSIIPNDQALFSKTGLSKILRYGLSTNAHIVEGEIISDNPPPPIGAKSNWISHSNLLAQLYFVVVAIG
jgi:hypothetical protein